MKLKKDAINTETSQDLFLMCGENNNMKHASEKETDSSSSSEEKKLDQTSSTKPSDVQTESKQKRKRNYARENQRTCRHPDFKGGLHGIRKQVWNPSKVQIHAKDASSCKKPPWHL